MAVVIIIAVLVIGLLLIATERVNRMNRAAVAMFMGVTCWLLYVGYGTQFVASEHPLDFLSYLTATSEAEPSVKGFIASEVFMPRLAAAAGVVLFLLGTMTIVEVLMANGCFDFVQEWLRTHSSRHYAWRLAGLTFLLSANLDNLTTACMMLSIMHTMVASRRARMTLGAIVVVATGCGGAFTVIGDVTCLSIWGAGLVTPTAYAAALWLPCSLACITTVWLLTRTLPRRIEWTCTAAPYRGDDTLLTRPQRLLMLLVGIGGLWFIPTFHRITQLPPALGALCVLSLLWVVTELVNRSLLGSDRMVRRQPIALQHMNVQNILFFLGVTLTLGAVSEAGILESFFNWSIDSLNNTYLIGTFMGALASVFNNVTVIVAGTSFFSPDLVAAHPELAENFGRDGAFWPLLSFSTTMGGAVLSIGSMAGVAMMRTEGVKLRWWLRNVSGRVLVGWAVGIASLALVARWTA